VARPLLLVLGASGLLLLLACSNVARTLMARSLRRRRELAIRAALGGGRARLVQMVFTENLLLSAVAGLGGVALTLGALQLLKATAGDVLPRLAAANMDGLVLAFASGVTVAMPLAFALLPALCRPQPASTLRGGVQADGHGRARPGWSLLVGGQVALAVCLLITSALLVRSLQAILSVDTGFRPRGVLTVALDFSASGSRTPDSLRNQVGDLKAALGSLPGVTGVGFVSYLPNVKRMMMGSLLRPPVPDNGLPDHWADGVGWRVVDQDYFRVMGIQLLEGRFFTSRDGPDSRPVVILNATAARALFPDGRAVGSRIQFDPFWQNTDLEVVGLVAETRDWRVAPGEQPEGFVCVSQRPEYARTLTAVLGTKGNPTSVTASARTRLREVAPGVPGTFQPLESVLADSYRDRTFTLGVVGGFAFLSLLLAAVGIYGVVSYTASARTREIGIMLALGAPLGRLRFQIALGSARSVVAGVAMGLGLALAAAGVLRGLLYGVQPRDPLAMVVAPLVLVTAAFAAILTPVIQCTRVDPASVMRAE
jgi:putative ABC transport system permease protein